MKLSINLIVIIHAYVAGAENLILLVLIWCWLIWVVFVHVNIIFMMPFWLHEWLCLLCTVRVQKCYTLLFDCWYSG